MGWLYSDNWRSASAVRDHLRDELKTSGYTILDDASTAYGRRYYALITKPNVLPTIFVALINGGRGYDDGVSWGYKDMDESMGPYEVDAPLRLLDKAGPPPNDYAAAWRDKVRAYHARRKAGVAAVKVAKRGDKVWLNNGRDTPYTVDRRYKNSLIGYRADGAGPFRLPTSYITRFEPAAL